MWLSAGGPKGFVFVSSDSRKITLRAAEAPPTLQQRRRIRSNFAYLGSPLFALTTRILADTSPYSVDLRLT